MELDHEENALDQIRPRARNARKSVHNSAPLAGSAPERKAGLASSALQQYKTALLAALFPLRDEGGDHGSFREDPGADGQRVL